jgi:hypothetical protein
MSSLALSSFQQSNHLSDANADVYEYDVIMDQDHDILNQGSVDHIHKYFDKKDTNTQVSSQNLLKNHLGSYSVNNVGFVLKIIILVIFLWIMWDFLIKK